MSRLAWIAGAARVLWQMLDALGPRQRAVVVLRFYLDISVEETAEILGITAGTVKSQSARALETLRALRSAKRGKDDSTDFR
jgi:RNA polymerase sigma factor (sigma-70 family)